MREFAVPPSPSVAEAAATHHNIADFLFASAADSPDHVAVRRRAAGGWADVTARQFADEVRALAKGLLAAKIEHGDRVAIMSRTRYEWTVADLACLAIGAVVVPIYDSSSAEQLEWILADSAANALFVEGPTHEDLVTSVHENTPALREMWAFDKNVIAELVHRGQDVPDDEFDRRRGLVRHDDLASIIYTSGTTGRPKGCELTHGNFVDEALQLLDGLDAFFNRDTSTLLFLPIAHVFGRAIEIGCLAGGCTLGHTGDVAELPDDLASFSPTFLLSVPRVFEKVYNSAKQKAERAGKGSVFDRAERVAISYSQALERGSVPVRLRAQRLLFDRLVYRKLRAALGGKCIAAVSGGAPLGARLGHFFRGVGVTIYEGYGLTETCAGITVNRPGAIKVGTVGRPVGGVSVKVADDGELLVKGGMVFRGYWRNEPATREAIDADGWLHTGDLGDIDEDGFVRITGRKKELIITANGKNVAPAVLEDRVRAHWLISQCLVVGDQRPFVAALITIDPEAWPQWLERVGRPLDSLVADLVNDPQLRAEIQSAVDEANRAVSRPESIRAFAILPEDWTVAGGQLTPSLKVRRGLVQRGYTDQIAALYEDSAQPAVRS